MNNPNQGSDSLAVAFGLVAPDQTQDSSNATRPFSVRLTGSERDALQARAGTRPLGAYIRDVLLLDKQRKRASFRRPRVDEKQIAQVLWALGQSRVASNLNQLAKSANVGTLDVDEHTQAQLKDACAAVLAMRDVLLQALGKNPKR